MRGRFRHRYSRSSIRTLFLIIALTFTTVVKYRDLASWAHLSSAFARSFCSANIRLIDNNAIRMAFIIGCSLGFVPSTPNSIQVVYSLIVRLRHPKLDSNLAARRTPQTLNRLQRRISSVGLINPVKMLSDALDRELAGSKQRFALQYETFERRFEMPQGQLLVSEGDDVAYEEEDVDGDAFQIDDAGNVL